jgi:hypothetical protein
MNPAHEITRLKANIVEIESVCPSAKKDEFNEPLAG